MKVFFSLLAVAAAVLTLTQTQTHARAADDKPDRTIAITIDDLPAGAANSMTAAEITSMTKQLTDTLQIGRAHV